MSAWWKSGNQLRFASCKEASAEAEDFHFRDYDLGFSGLDPP
jgi:hypothetical protein